MSKQARLEARVAPEVHALLKRAAEIEGRTMTDFVVAAASAAARQTIEGVEVLRLSRAAQDAFARDLLNPPAIAPAMKRARERHATLVRSD